VVLPDGAGERELHRIVGTGGSFGSATLRQEIGLGRATAIKRVEIYWPGSATTQVLEGLRPDQCYHVREGEAEATPVALRTFAWPPGAVS